MPRQLDAFFSPASIAVIGASDESGSVGQTLLRNLAPFHGRVYPVNPNHESIDGKRSYARVEEIDACVDLAIIATPAKTVVSLLEECAQAGVGSAIIITAGFGEGDEAGQRRERQIAKVVEKTGIRVIGPNCLGLMRPANHLNATFASKLPAAGGTALLSQSGALLTAMLDMSEMEAIGFSAVISTGGMVDVSWGDLLRWCETDDQTRSIVIYMESLEDAGDFLCAARAISPTKPIVVLKAGKSEQAAQAAASHTGALAGSTEAIAAAFEQAGVLSVQRISELFGLAEVLEKQPIPLGDRLVILSNAGGPGVLATDALAAGGAQLAELSEACLHELNDMLPDGWSRANPVDILGDAGPERYRGALEILAAQHDADALLLILTPQAMTEPAQIADAVASVAEGIDIPILGSWMGGEQVRSGEERLNRSGIPTFSYPDDAARVFAQLARRHAMLARLTERPKPEFPDSASRTEVTAELTQQCSSQRKILSEDRAKWVLTKYRIPVVQTLPADTPEQAAYVAQDLGFPVVLKLRSEEITHKSDVGGVQLDLRDSRQVHEAFRAIRDAVTERFEPSAFGGVTVQRMLDTSAGFELIAGASHDNQLGPVMLFGAGGTLVEIFKDKSLALPPLSRSTAMHMIDQTQISAALDGFRGRPAILHEQLYDTLVRLGTLLIDQPSIREIDINPLFASDTAITAMDARIVLFANDEAPVPAAFTADDR